MVDVRMEPVGGCFVSANGEPWKNNHRRSHDRAVTEDDGVFFVRVGDTLPRTVMAWKEGVGTGQVMQVAPGRGKSAPHVTIALEPCRAIAGVLVHADGTPAPGRELSANGIAYGTKVHQKTNADKEGRFRFSDLPDGLYDVGVKQIGIPGNVGSLDRRIPIKVSRVAPGTEDIFLTLPPASTFAARLIDLNGNPVSLEPKIQFQQTVRHNAEQDSSCTFSMGCADVAVETRPGVFELRSVTR